MEILIKQMKDLHSEVLLSAKPDESKLLIKASIESHIFNSFSLSFLIECKKLLDNIDMNFKLLSKQIKEDLNCWC